MSYSCREMSTLDSYFRAQLVLKNRDRRKLCNNTYLERLGDCIAVLLHRTYIIKFYPDGRIVLNTNGWETVTTKQRLNALLKQQIWTCDGLWLIVCRDGYYIYEDGMTIDKDGFPDTKPLPCYQLGLLTGGEYKNMMECVEGLKSLSLDEVKQIIRGRRKYNTLQENVSIYREDAVAELVKNKNSDQLERFINYCHESLVKPALTHCRLDILPLLIGRIPDKYAPILEHRLKEGVAEAA